MKEYKVRDRGVGKPNVNVALQNNGSDHVSLRIRLQSSRILLAVVSFVDPFTTREAL